MKIELELPFSIGWRSGYLRESKKDGRKRVDLFNSNRDRTTISYARYLMSVHLGRHLEDWEEVDHIDEDKTNDEICNLQVLSRDSHIAKTNSKVKRKTSYDLICGYCNLKFVRYRFDKRYKNVFCSTSCAAMYKNKK